MEAMTVADYPKCRTCRHYGHEPSGQCHLISNGVTSIVAVIASDDDVAGLYTHPDRFGCLLHEPEESSAQQIERTSLNHHTDL